MNIRFCISSTLQSNTLAMQMTQLLREELSSKGCNFDSRSPDIYHLFGCWDSNITALASRLRHQHIPYIFSPMGELQPWSIAEHNVQINLHRKQYNVLLKNAMAIHLCSRIEHANLPKKAQLPQDIFVTSNPVVTQSITTNEVTATFLKVYGNAIHRHDEHMRDTAKSMAEHAIKDIDSKTLGQQRKYLISILEQIFYCRYLYNRQHLQRDTLQTLTHTMTEADYNEDLMAQILHKENLKDFFASLETVMHQHANLTEGFMPIPNADNRLTKKILKNLI